MSIQGFLSDRSLIDATKSLINLESLNLPCGFLDRDTIEFFVEPLEVADLRTGRLPITYRPEENTAAPDEIVLEDGITNIFQIGMNHLATYPNETVTLAQYADLDYLEFVNDILPEGPVAILSNREIKLTLDATKLTGDDREALLGINSLEQQRLFNVIEYLIYGTIVSDTIPDINSYLASNPEKFLGYVPNTVTISGARTIIKIFGGINIHRFTPRSIGFKFIIGNYQVQINLWMDKSAFKSEYPESTIINVVPPLDLNVLLDPSTLVDPIDSAILSKKWSDTLVQPEITNRDQSGMYLFETRYIYRGKTYQITFSLIYRGRCPDSMEARNYIADYLLNSGVGTKALWEIVLPDIFYHSAFLLIPFYDNITKLTNADIYPSIIKTNELADKMNSIIELIPRATDPYRELMTAAYEKFFIGVAPADVNESSSMLALHPTYRDFSTSDTGWAEMNAVDREFSIKLNQALSVATGETNILTFNTVESGNLRWVNFVYDYVSYLVLTKESYNEHFQIG
jgi:hypothetical protein